MLAPPNSPTQDSGEVLEARTPSIGVSDETQELLFRARVAQGREGLHRLTNLRATVRQAEEELENGAEMERDVSAQISEDWLSNWREGAERVNDADVQRLWARILKTEVSRPGSISLRSLLFMRGLDRVDAELIELLGSFVIDGEYVLKLDELLEKEGLGLNQLLALEDMTILTGVSSGIGGLSRSMTVRPSKPLLAQFANKEALVLKTDAEITIDDECYVVTRVGREVLKLGDFKANVPYVEAVITLWKSRGVHMQQGKLASKEGSQVTVTDLHDV